MSMSYTLKELRELPLEELIKAHDHDAQHTVVGTKYYLDEIARRDAEAQTNAMIRLTRRVELLTWLIAVLTLVNAVAAVLTFFK